MPDHHSPTLEVQQVLTKLLRQFFARSGESKLTSSADHPPECCCPRGHAACQDRRTQPQISVQRRASGNG
jgi:hypothetical protein